MKKVKVKGFFSDITGQMRADKKRKACIKSGSDKNDYSDPIKELCQKLHPDKTEVSVFSVEEVSPTSKRIVFKPNQGYELPPFQAGQYVSLDLKIGSTITTRPYSICSAPYQARQKEDPFFAITVRKGKPGQGFASNYLYENVKPGDAFIVHFPFGHFYIEPLRDSKNIVALAGGSGVTPFLSMAQEIAHGGIDADLTILLGSVSKSDIVLKKQLEEVAASCSRVRLIHVISGPEEELDEGDERGFLSAEIIRKYMGEDPTFFLCGPLPMYQFALGELGKLGIHKGRIRTEVFGAPRDISQCPGYPKEMLDKTFSLTVVRGINETKIPAKACESLAVALERAGILIHTCCRSGECGACRVQVLSGECFVPPFGDGRRMADKDNGFVHSCSAFPLSDMTIKINIL